MNAIRNPAFNIFLHVLGTLVKIWENQEKPGQIHIFLKSGFDIELECTGFGLNKIK